MEKLYNPYCKKNNLNINISYGDFSSKDFDQTDLEIVSIQKNKNERLDPRFHIKALIWLF